MNFKRRWNLPLHWNLEFQVSGTIRQFKNCLIFLNIQQIHGHGISLQQIRPAAGRHVPSMHIL